MSRICARRMFVAIALLMMVPTHRANADEITISVHRGDAWSGYLRDYEVHVNGQLIGYIANNSMKLFQVAPAKDGKNRIHFECSSFFGAVTSRSLTGEFNAIDGDLIRASFTGGGQDFPVEIQHLGNPAAEKRKRIQLEEGDFHAYVTAELSLAPQWFKKRTKEAVPEKSYWKGTYFAPLVQCQPVLRVLSLVVLLYPILAWMIYREVSKSGDPNQEAIIGALVMPVIGLLLLFPLSYIVEIAVGLAAYVITGEEYYAPFQFVLFSLVSIAIISIIAWSIRPLAEIVRNGLPVHRMLGAAGIVIELFGILFTLREILQFAVQR